MLKYWLWLATRKGLGTRGACLVARHFSSPEAAFFAPPEAYKEIEGLRNVQPLLNKDLTLPETIIRQCYEKGISIVTIQDAAYPKRLRTIDDAPVVLYCKGALPDLNVPSVAIVGTREASVYGMTQAKRFAYGLARCGCAVISGGARGVDSEALRGALLGGGPAIAVLGCGLDVTYPRENKQLFRDVAQSGCLISEFPPGTAPYGSNFPQRNRMISALSLGVLVTEAPVRSGALITADCALEQGRDVFVLPANIGVESCGGNLRLLRDGAVPVGDVWDILQEYAPQYPQILKKRDISLRTERPRETNEEKKVIDKPKTKAYIDLKDIMDTLTAEEQAFVRLLANGAMHIDALVEQTGLTVGGALASLTVLEVKGIVTRPSVRMYELAEK